MPRDYTVKKALPQPRYGRLTVLANAKGGWLCRCDCGVEKIVRTQSLKTGATTSCGCYRLEQRGKPLKHGMTYTPIYRLWVSMKDRCYRPTVPNFKFYGGRGITVCARWHTFENFYADMGNRPPGHSLDRIDNSRGYEPANCRWAPLTEQHMNRRSNHLLTLNGVTKPLTVWAQERGLKPVTVFGRIRRGLTVEAALQPLRG